MSFLTVAILGQVLVTPAPAWQQLGFGSNWSGSSPVFNIQTVGDFDSLVASNVTNKEWLRFDANVLPNIASSSGPFVPASPLISAVDLNPLNQTAISAQMANKFSVPPNTTSVTFDLYVADAGTNPYTMSISQASGCTASGCNALLPTTFVPGPQALQSISFSTTPGTEYYVGFDIGDTSCAANGWCNNGGSAGTGHPVIGRVRVKPAGATGLFASDFYRVGVDPTLLWYSNRDQLAVSGQLEMVIYGTGAEMVLDTDCTSMAIESEQSNVSVDAIQSVIVWSNGQYLSSIAPGSSSVGNFATVSLPSGMKRIEVESGAAKDTGSGSVRFSGTFVQAVYMPASCTTFIVPPNYGPRRLLVIGDSISEGQNGTTGGGATPGLLSGWTQLLRRLWSNGQVYIDAWGGRQLYNDIGSGGTAVDPVGLQRFVDSAAAANPTDIWFALSINDWSGAQWTTVAAFQTAYGTALDALHARLPQARIFAQSDPITVGFEGNNSLGQSHPSYRTAQQNACAARPWCNFVDGTAATFIPSTTYIASDGIHPTLAGHSFIARSVFNSLTTTQSAADPPSMTGGPTTSATYLQIDAGTANIQTYNKSGKALAFEIPISIYDPVTLTTNTSDFWVYGPTQGSMTLQSCTCTVPIAGGGTGTEHVKVSTAAAGGGVDIVDVVIPCNAAVGASCTACSMDGGAGLALASGSTLHAAVTSACTTADVATSITLGFTEP